MKRIFVAISISEELQNQAFDFRRSHQNIPVRWLSGKNLHITLIPPWYTDDINSVKEVLHEINEIKGEAAAFELRFQKISFGPSFREPRLIWAEGETPQEIPSLIHNLQKILNQKDENRPFRLHLTLARFHTEDFMSFPTKELNEKIDWREKVSSIVLMESHLSPKGADYEVLEEIKF